MASYLQICHKGTKLIESINTCFDVLYTKILSLVKDVGTLAVKHCFSSL